MKKQEYIFKVVLKNILFSFVKTDFLLNFKYDEFKVQTFL